MAGHVYGLYTVLEIAEAPAHITFRAGAYWKCRCACGVEKIIAARALRNGTTKSCGCTSNRSRGQHMTLKMRHGLSGHPSYRTWVAILERCYSPTAESFHLYGGRGIGMCDRWRRDVCAFIKDVGPRPGPEFSIDRIDPNRGYEPGNVRWATIEVQANNTRSNRRITYNDETMTLSQWARKIGVHPGNLNSRLKRMPLERAMTPGPLQRSRRQS